MSDLDQKRATAACAIEAWFAEQHDEPSTLISLVVVAEMQTLSGDVWLTRATATGTGGDNQMPKWTRDGMLRHGMSRFDSEDDE